MELIQIKNRNYFLLSNYDYFLWSRRESNNIYIDTLLII